MGTASNGFHLQCRCCRTARVPRAILAREGAVHFLQLRFAGEYSNSRSRIRAPPQFDVDSPRLREHLSILDRGFVLNRVVAGHAVFLSYAQRVAVKIAGHVEPRLVVVVGYVHHQRVAIPVAPRIAHPEVHVFRVRSAVGVDQAILQLPFEGDGHHRRRLEDLKRIIQIHDAGNAPECSTCCRDRPSGGSLKFAAFC